MATDNPKVQGYVDPATFAQLMDWKDKQGCKSVSEAVTLILRRFFEGESEGDSPSPGEGTRQGEGGDRLTALEMKIAHLTERVSYWEGMISGSQRTQPIELNPSPSTSDQGISQTALCSKFGIDSKSVARLARRKGLEVSDYLRTETGWKQDGKRWFPPQ